MTTTTKPTNFYADFSGLASLKGAAKNQDPKALRETARQFESLFTQMMLKSMRQASMGDSLLDNDQSKFYRDMFDNQLSVQLSKGKGLGLADMLVRQLSQGAVDPADTKVATQKAAALTMPTRPSAAESKPNIPSAIAAAENISSTAAQPMSKLEVQNTFDAIAGGNANVGDAANHETPSAKSTGPNNAEAPNKRTTPDLKPVDTLRKRPQPLANSQAEFVNKLWPHAQVAARELGVDAKTLIAHAALETGWGKFIPCNPDGSCSFNLFGIKASSQWKGDAVAVNTLEFTNGIAVKRLENFRAYDSPAESFRDYAALIKNSPRYSSAIGTGQDAAAFAYALQQGGYATDPNYAAKLAAVADKLNATLKPIATQPLAFGRHIPNGEAT